LRRIVGSHWLNRVEGALLTKNSSLFFIASERQEVPMTS
jgi:hypothetical protein